eukprot:3238374-Alexandrium_andersonii.AAC.1
MNTHAEPIKVDPIPPRHIVTPVALLHATSGTAVASLHEIGRLTAVSCPRQRSDYADSSVRTRFNTAESVLD